LQNHLVRSSGYRADIDGLRAIAILAVVGFHAFPGYLPGGFTGVDVFFVISGFLISGIIFEELQAGRFSYAGFYGRRVRRIFPALIVVLLACFTAGWFALANDEYKALGKHMAAGAAFVSNLALWSEAGYFDAAAETKPLLHLWSLGIEEQFYVFWPLLAGWAWRRRLNLLAVAALIALASFALNLVLTERNIVAAFYSPLSRFWELMAGSALAWLRVMRPGAAMPRPDLLSAAGLCLIATGIALLDGRTAFPGVAALLPVLGAALVIAAGPAAWVNRKLLSARPLVWIGLISYPWYLWHWPLLVFADQLGGMSATPVVRALMAGLSLLLAWATYRLVESPLRGRRLSRSLIAALAAGMGLAAVLGGIAYERDGFDARAANQASLQRQRWQETQRWTDEDIGTAACRKAFLELNYCKLETGGEAPSVALVGDSYANMLYYGLRDQYRRRGQVLLQAGNGNCPPLLGVESNFIHWDGSVCVRASQAYFGKIAADPRIRTVILAGNWHLYLIGNRLYRSTEKTPAWKLRGQGLPESAGNGEVFGAALERTVQFLEQAGKRVIFFHQPPELDYRLSDCAPYRNAPREKCRTALAVEMAYLGEYRLLAAPVLKRHPSVAVIDPVALFCDPQFCHSTIDGTPLYRDEVHLSRDGSAYLGRKISLPE